MLGFSLLSIMLRDKTQTKSAVFADPFRSQSKKAPNILRMEGWLFPPFNVGRKVQFHRRVHDVAESALLVP